MLELIVGIIGLFAGGVIAWLVLRGNIFRLQDISNQYRVKEDEYQRQVQSLIQLEAEKSMLLGKIEELSLSLAQEREQKELKEMEIRRQVQVAATLESANESLTEKLETQKEEIKTIREQMYNEFQLLSSKILDEKSRKFVEVNEEKVGAILNPLKEKIQSFEKKVEETYSVELREKASLREQLTQIANMNHQMSEDAKNLTRALKGDSKMQGNWGEIQLELLLEKSGLIQDIHYKRQVSLKDDEGRPFRPDFAIYLPEGKNFIIDSKVSLTAYEKFFNAEDDAQKKKYLNEHIASLNNHINDLSFKNYHSLYGINPPDFVFLFVPVEPAFTLAVQSDSGLFDKALSKNVILVVPSTLLATMRTVSFIWKQENQRKNVLEIAKESGALYDKFVGFIEDLDKIQKAINDTERYCNAAKSKLYSSSKKGDTIIGRVERIKKLGANASKALPPGLLDKAEDKD
ncbi:MAG: DNA recombination protein RmuC [Bacteroidales bacterium]|jgi:DNA recombination protein RmuC|nr:DNA recombination protein RmuC [Bacteroidales bacterium]